MASNDCSLFFHKRFGDSKITAWRAIGAHAIATPLLGAWLALAFGILRTPVRIEQLAKGPLFSFKAVCVGTILGAVPGAYLGARTGRKVILSDTPYKSFNNRPEQSNWEGIGFLAFVASVFSILTVSPTALCIPLRRYTPSFVASAWGGVLSLGISYVFALSTSNCVTRLVWPQPQRSGDLP